MLLYEKIRFKSKTSFEVVTCFGLGPEIYLTLAVLSVFGLDLPKGPVNLGTLGFEFSPKSNFHSGLSLCWAGSHAFLWTGQVPELRIYVVGAAGGPSFGPKSQFSSFSGGPETHHPALC